MTTDKDSFRLVWQEGCGAGTRYDNYTTRNLTNSSINQGTEEVIERKQNMFRSKLQLSKSLSDTKAFFSLFLLSGNPLTSSNQLSSSHPNPSPSLSKELQYLPLSHALKKTKKGAIFRRFISKLLLTPSSLF